MLYCESQDTLAFVSIFVMVQIIVWLHLERCLSALKSRSFSNMAVPAIETWLVCLANSNSLSLNYGTFPVEKQGTEFTEIEMYWMDPCRYFLPQLRQLAKIIKLSFLNLPHCTTLSNNLSALLTFVTCLKSVKGNLPEPISCVCTAWIYYTLRLPECLAWCFSVYAWKVAN